MYEIQEYKESHKEQVIHFMKVCMPENERVFDLEDKHSMYQDVRCFYDKFWCLVNNEEVIGTVALKAKDEQSCELKAVFLLKAYQGKQCI
ncbi:MAG: hypothetical protein J6F30_05580 [Cellulosilyticum sp.]|nr:hypothetical protein [Cellulosilyticum sp.]